MTARCSPYLTRVRSQPLPFRRASAAFPFGLFNGISPGSTSRLQAALRKRSSRTGRPSQPLQRALAPTDVRSNSPPIQLHLAIRGSAEVRRTELPLAPALDRTKPAQPDGHIPIRSLTSSSRQALLLMSFAI